MMERFLRWAQRRIIWRLLRPLERADFAIAWKCGQPVEVTVGPLRRPWWWVETPPTTTMGSGAVVTWTFSQNRPPQP